MVWQAVATGIGALAGAYSSHRNRQNQQRSISRNEAREDTKIQRTVDQAKAAGIHPLAALGASPSYSSPAVVDNTGSAIGDGIARTIQAKQGVKQSNLQSTLIQTQIDEATSRTQLAKAQAFRVLHPQAEIPRISTTAIYTDKDGNDFLGPNPEANEMSPAELAASNIVLTGAKAYHDAGIATQNNNIIDRAWEALTGRKMRRDHKDPKTIIKKSTLKPYGYEHNNRNDTYKRK
ncbi:MAG: minor capsid protein [Cressdnaviricota sp.]|nr:MAG: minor capsid protein [Cressdnaviricota sp.]